MKKFFIALTLLMISLGANAQVKHFKFNGIPIDGTIDSFQTRLVRQGFQAVVWKNDVYLEGTYLGEPIRLQTAVGPRTGKVAIVAFLTKKEFTGQTVLGEVERWKTILKRAYNATFYESGKMYKADVLSSERGRLAVDILQSDPNKDLYVVRVMICDLENVGK